MSRTKKRRRRLAGRHRKLDADRTATGQLSRRQRDAGPTPEALRQRLRQLPAETMAHGLRIDRQDLMGPDAGWPIGRLYLAGLLQDGPEEQHREVARARRDAAYAFWKTAGVYASLLLAPRQPTAMEPGRPPLGRSDADNEDQFVLIKATYDASYEALRQAGYEVLLAVSRAVNDQQVPLDLLKQGLDVLTGKETRKAVAERRKKALEELQERKRRRARHAIVPEPVPEPA